MFLDEGSDLCKTVSTRTTTGKKKKKIGITVRDAILERLTSRKEKNYISNNTSSSQGIKGTCPC